MKITPNKGKLGYILIALAIILFSGYWYYLLEPLQAKLIEEGKTPSLVLAVVRSLITGSVIAFFTFVGGAMAGLAWQKWTKEVDLNLGDALESPSFIKWAAIWNVGFLLFTLLWKYGNF